ncbi:hypothetical protein T4B_12027 [Trichinella pseudospiralis]|uniref:Uncharacterized protein n=1 Tax=Trichinella pseudospiralis TaxID=6337 RepID=A0A0V1IGL5_TRIPS|nr:hypothetical protein T4B_12027 [Trichinella pseudospiralis]
MMQLLRNWDKFVSFSASTVGFVLCYDKSTVKCSSTCLLQWKKEDQLSSVTLHLISIKTDQ